MKVNRKYLKSLPALSQYSNLILQIHQTQKLVQELVPRNIELTVEIMNDCTFLNDGLGRPVCVMSVGNGEYSEELVESFAMSLRDLVSSMRFQAG